MIDWGRLVPGYWIQLHRTVAEWDAFLAGAIATGEITEINKHTCKVGGVRVWIANWPHAYGHPYDAGFPEDMLPTVRTRKMLRRAVLQAAFKQAESRIGKMADEAVG